jgi:hypothetical protein
MGTEQAPSKVKDAAKARNGGVRLARSDLGPGRVLPVQARVLSLQSRAGNGACTRAVQRWREESGNRGLTQRRVGLALIQRISYEKGFGAGSWEGWTGPWRDEATQTLWGTIDLTYNGLRDKIKGLGSETSEDEKVELATIAESLDAMDAKPIQFRDGQSTFHALLGYAEQIKTIEAAIEFRKKAPEESPAPEDEEATGESTVSHHLWALGLLAAGIAWQTYRDRQGKQARGRGAHVVETMSARMDEAIRQLGEQVEAASQVMDEQVEAANEVRALVRQPALEGFLMGVAPWPMPVAQVYAPWGEVQRTFYRVLFLVTASREEMDEYAQRVGAFALKSRPGEQSRGAPSKTIGASTADTGKIMDDAIKKRNALSAGFVTGVGVGSAIQGQIPVLSDPVMGFQAPWDAYHVLNDLAVRTRMARMHHQYTQVKLRKYNARLLEIYGRRAVSQKPARALLLLVRLFKR